MRSQLGWRTWVSLACVSPLCNTRSRGADDISTTVTNLVSAVIISTRLIVVVFHIPLDRSSVMPQMPVTSHRWNREKRCSTRNARIDRERSKTYDRARLILFKFPKANPIKCDNIDNIKIMLLTRTYIIMLPLVS